MEFRDGRIGQSTAEEKAVLSPGVESSMNSVKDQNGFSVRRRLCRQPLAGADGFDAGRRGSPWSPWSCHFSTPLPQWDQMVVFKAPACLVTGLAWDLWRGDTFSM